MNVNTNDNMTKLDRALTPTEKTPMTEQQKRWLSWNVVSGKARKATQQYGVKGSFEGIDPAVKAKRRKTGKAAKQARKDAR